MPSFDQAFFAFAFRQGVIRLATPGNWFCLSHGGTSPLYLDLRQLGSYYEWCWRVVDRLSIMIKLVFPKTTFILGVATAGIPWAALVSQNLHIGWGYVRSASKNHGAKQMIEGQVKPTDLIVVIDDVLTTGQSAYRAVKIAQRHTSAQVQGVVAIFSYETKFQTVYANRYQTPCRAVLTLSDLKLFLQTYHHLQVTAYQQVVEALSDHFEVPP